MIQSNSVLHSFSHNESLLCNRAQIWCASNTTNANLMWYLLNSDSLLSTAMEIQLCTYTFKTGAYCRNGSTSNNEGVYQCVQSYSASSSTLQFTHSVYNLNGNEMCSTQSSFITVTQTSYLTSTPKDYSTVYPMPNSSCSLQSSTVPHYTGIGLLVATNLLTIIALISSCVYIFCQRKKSKL